MTGFTAAPSLALPGLPVMFYRFLTEATNKSTTDLDTSSSSGGSDRLSFSRVLSKI